LHYGLAPGCISEHDCFSGGSDMVWAVIRAHGKTDLHVIETGTLTADRYINESLDVYVRTHASAVGPDFILVND